tara:strand:- start:37 stop:552 length:516 start_codon:yes stop_codon:yes gene_type:complete
MPLIKKPFWSENGLFRKHNIAPDNRLDELKLRKNMMQWHQKLALINLGLIGYQYYLGRELDSGNLSSDKYNQYKLTHKNLGYTTFTIYMSSAGLSIFSPPALKYDRGLSSMKLHRYLATIHFVGMAIQPWLGYQTSKGGENYSDYIDMHKQAGEIILGTYFLSFLLTLLPS